MNTEPERAEKIAMIVLALGLIIGSALLHVKRSAPCPIVIEKGGALKECSLAEAAAAAREKALIDINTAREEELCSLPGIGGKIAQRMIEYREKAGPFSSPEDLMKVKGIGEGKLKEIRPFVKFK